MNSVIENLNRWGTGFTDCAWPILWQSSLLIAAVYAIDFLFRRRIRASVRYALWLVVFVKLFLPPTLAFPSSAAWWLFPKRPIAGVLAAPKYIVTYDSTLPLTDPVAAPDLTIPVPAPRLNNGGRVLIGFGFVSCGLLLWLGFRWCRISRKIHRTELSEGFASLLEDIARCVGMRSRLRLKVTDGQMSPAVCGLFRPVILLPRVLAKELTDAQLRSVLLHEAFHLRRKDVWVNCAQALVQIVYWWHPLLWLANARIRRLREEAVDDSVMLALRGEADSYAPTLVAVAKWVLRRPLMSLGLVGIMESRSALQKRIERLVDFRAPRKAGLTFVSICAIFVFSAVALPMGQAPGSAPDAFSATTTSAEKTLTMKVNPKVFIRNIKAKANWVLATPADAWTKILLDIMRSETVDCSPPHGIRFDAKTGEITTRNAPEQLKIFHDVIEQLNRPDGGFEMPDIPRRKVLIDARYFWMSSDDCKRLVADLPSERGKNERTPYWMISPEGFNEVNRRIASLDLQPFQRPRIETADGVMGELWVGNNKTNGLELDCLPFEADKGLDNGRKGIALVFRTETIGNPAGPKQELSGTNRFRASGEVGVEDRGGFIVSAEDADGSPTNVVMVVGVRVVTNTVRSSARLDQPQIHIKAHFLEAPKSILEGFVKIIGITNQSDQIVRILPGQDAAAALEKLKSRSAFEELAAPETTTTSGRQTEMRATTLITVVTNFAYSEASHISAVFPQTNSVETGPVLDTVATVLPDGYTVDLRAIASLTEFLGYDKTTNTSIAYTSAGQKIDLPNISPAFNKRKASAHVRLWDGRTLIMGLKSHFLDDGKEVGAEPGYFVKAKANRGETGDQSKEVLVFITATLVDPAGRRIHSDTDMPFAKNSTPPHGVP